ncbi:hypothetical protein BgiMline_003292 [Biomphalaria glabrata]|nr:hypothetical protein BgiBS90_006279 [Biomphalaria glabrata]
MTVRRHPSPSWPVAGNDPMIPPPQIRPDVTCGKLEGFSKSSLQPSAPTTPMSVFPRVVEAIRQWEVLYARCSSRQF